jgi:predicted DNA-binding protein (MmcQ/YjbR family)
MTPSLSILPLILTAVARGQKIRKSRTGDLRRVSRSLREFALAFPGATEDFPWGDRVAKVKGKIFVSLGLDPVPGSAMTLTLKLPVSHEAALDLPFTAPTGYGLGKAGWVTATFGPADRPPMDILKGWIVESYRAVAPKKLVADLDAR